MANVLAGYGRFADMATYGTFREIWHMCHVASGLNFAQIIQIDFKCTNFFWPNCILSEVYLSNEYFSEVNLWKEYFVKSVFCRVFCRVFSQECILDSCRGEWAGTRGRDTALMASWGSGSGQGSSNNKIQKKSPKMFHNKIQENPPKNVSQQNTRKSPKKCSRKNPED